MRAPIRLLLPLLFLLAHAAVADPDPPGHVGQDPEQTGALPGVDRKAAAQLPTVTVKAVPGAQALDALIAPVSVLSGVALDEARASTLGQTVANLPGMHTSAFGQGAGRPVIRGLDGPRVAVLSDGLGTGDVSSVSQDHGVSIEPFLADQIEILKGPATLLYGSGAIGGVVNVVDGRIPQRLPDNGFSGRVQTGYDSVSSGNTEAFRVDGGGEHFALHADGLARNDHDYDVRGARLANSAVDARTGALGGSWIDDWGHAGISLSRYLDNYGNPAEPGDVATGAQPVHLRMQQTRIDTRGTLTLPLAGIDRFEWSFGHVDYQHTEYEGDHPGTIFTSRSSELLAVATTLPLRGWNTAFGLQGLQRDLAALGDEAFVPPTTTRLTGLFATARHEAGALTLELGARADWQASRPLAQAQRSFQPLSLSAGLAWRLDAIWHLTFNLDRAQRAPAEEELYAHGPHAASATFEIGDPLLRAETAHQIELATHYHGERFDAKLSMYANRYDDFIHLAETGQIEAGFPVRNWSQRRALFRGGEAEATWHLAATGNGHYDLRAWGDAVRATLANGGGNVPRIPTARLGVQLRWHNDDWRASIGTTRWFSHDDVAMHETPTAGFTMITAHLAWSFLNTDRQSWELFLDGNNLGDRVARLSTSLIKDTAPLPGRNFSFGVRVLF